MWRLVPLVRTDFSEERTTSINVARMGELGTTLAVTGNWSTLLYSVVFFRSLFPLVVTANVVPSSQILVTLMTEAIRYSETLILIRATRHHISEDGILHGSTQGPYFWSYNFKCRTQWTGRAVWGRRRNCLRLFECWIYGFQSHSGPGCLRVPSFFLCGIVILQRSDPLS
jgi:hypothetical protein